MRGPAFPIVHSALWKAQPWPGYSHVHGQTRARGHRARTGRELLRWAGAVEGLWKAGDTEGTASSVLTCPLSSPSTIPSPYYRHRSFQTSGTRGVGRL